MEVEERGWRWRSRRASTEGEVKEEIKGRGDVDRWVDGEGNRVRWERW